MSSSSTSSSTSSTVDVTPIKRGDVRDSRAAARSHPRATRLTTSRRSRAALTALVAPALASVLLLAACSTTPPSSPGSPRSSSSPLTPAPPTPSSRTDWTPIPVQADASLPAGRLGMTANGRPDAPWAVVEVPKGFSTIGGWVIFDEDPAGGGGVGYWTISEVVRNPCGDPEPLTVGDTVDDVVSAFRQQRLARHTTPVPVTVDGHRGLSFQVAVPDGLDLGTCGEFLLWESDPAGSRHMGGPGEFDRLWVLSVDGQVVVLTVTADAGVPKSALQRLTRMVEAVTFVPRSKAG